MKILAIEASSLVASVAILTDDTITAEYSMNHKITHSQTLMPMIDEIIKSHLSAKWSLERINKVALAVIRMSVYALLYQKDVPAVIVIDEAVEIVKEYGIDDSHKFTNAILDNINKDLSK